MRALLTYFANLKLGKKVLWCYLIWYIAIMARSFEPSPRLWVSSVGMSAIIGLVLILSTSGGAQKPDGWTVFRLFLMPFCVSSYAASVVGKGFVLIFPPDLLINLIALGACVVFLVGCAVLRVIGFSAESPGRASANRAAL